MDLPPPPPPPIDLPSSKSRARKLQRQRAEARFTHKLLTSFAALQTHPGSSLSRRGAALQDALLCINSPCHGVGSHFTEFDTILYSASDVSIASDSHRYAYSPCQDASSPLTDFDTIVSLATDVSISSAISLGINSPCHGVGSHFTEIDTLVSPIHASTSPAMRVFINSPCQGVGSHLAHLDADFAETDTMFFPASDASITPTTRARINSPCQGVGSPTVVLDTIVPSTGDTSTVSIFNILQADLDMSPAVGKTHATSPMTCVSFFPAPGPCTGQKFIDKDLEPAFAEVQAMGAASSNAHEVSLRPTTDIDHLIAQRKHDVFFPPPLTDKLQLQSWKRELKELLLIRAARTRTAAPAAVAAAAAAAVSATSSGAHQRRRRK
jgi:hypothetical protein